MRQVKPIIQDPVLAARMAHEPLLDLLELCEAIIEEAEDNWDYATDTGASANVEMSFFLEDLKAAVKKVKSHGTS